MKHLYASQPCSN